MLTKDALTSALPLTEILDGSKLFVSAIPGTPLAELVKATRADDNFVVTEGTSFQPDVENIVYIANAQDPVLKYAPHDMVMDDIADTAIKAVQGHIAFARNVVAPAIGELVTKVQQSLGEITASSLLGMEVVLWNPPKPLESSVLDASVSRFTSVAYDVPPLTMRLPDRTGVEIMELLHTGTAGLDGDIDEWAAGKGEGFFINVWENLFQQKPTEAHARGAKSFRDFTEDREIGLDITLAVYLLARRLADEPLEGTEMNLSHFESLVIEFRNQSGMRLSHAIEDLDKAVKFGFLVRSYTDRVTVVNGQVYRKWIEEGGENEVLFGNLLELPALTTVEQLNEKAAGLKAAWNHHCALTATVENNRRFIRTKDILLKTFAAQLSAITEGDEATLANKTEVLKLFLMQLEVARESELQDLYTLCLRLVCRSRFVRTDAERILEGIERVKRENPSIDVREAAAVSVIDYVAYWVSAQFQVTAL